MVKRRGKNEGTIFYDEKNKRWIAQAIIGYKDDGHTKRKTLIGKTKKEVAEKLANVLRDIGNQTYVEKNDITLIQLIEELNNDKLSSNRITERTYLRNLDTVRQIKDGFLANAPIQSINERQIVAFLNSKTNYSNSSIHKIYMMLRQAFKKAMRRKLISFDPMADQDEVPRPKSNKADKEVIAFTVEEQKKLEKVLNNEEILAPYRNIILLSLHSGMRIGEVLALDKTKDLDFENNRISIRVTLTRDIHDKVILGKTTKTYNSKRQITMTPILEKILRSALLRSCKNPYNLLFWDHEDETFITPNEVNSYFKRICKKYNIAPYASLHMLRHTYATRCIEAGINAKILQKKLGHKKIDTTLNTYTSVFARFEETQDEKYNLYMSEHNLLTEPQNLKVL